MHNPLEILTVGHSNHSFGDLLLLLRSHQVTVVGDVRSVPYSRRYPQFNRRALESSLEASGIRYVFWGAELGARTRDPSCYDEEGRVSFPRLAQTDDFLRGIEGALRTAESSRLALLCAEREPTGCHRTILVAPALTDRGVSITHILADGRLETQEELLDRLCAAMGMPPRDMFQTRSQQWERVLARRAREVAYVDPARSQAGRLPSDEN